MRKGTVKFFNKAKGFGFIKVEGTGEEIFVHATGLTEGTQLKDGDHVSFNIEKGKKGMVAVDVEKE